MSEWFIVAFVVFWFGSLGTGFLFAGTSRLEYFPRWVILFPIGMAIGGYFVLRLGVPEWS